ncbi:hypothetical protein OESDEN_12217 [Oesophagostomum dentatum]|uniref:C2H2-type domain-containing protein n=1 Tax=Oesophagostomum dentatum TaxID=61180 RepID=A0A0B1SSR3_OESDE|nr:hypothetical protein OESDEN_12217 [Oesophagostomum dentatum]
MKVVVDVCQNTDLVELLSFAKSREMAVIGFPDNPELEFLRSNNLPNSSTYRTPDKVAQTSAPPFETPRTTKQSAKRSHGPSCTSTSTTEEEHCSESEVRNGRMVLPVRARLLPKRNTALNLSKFLPQSLPIGVLQSVLTTPLSTPCKQVSVGEHLKHNQNNKKCRRPLKLMCMKCGSFIINQISSLRKHAGIHYDFARYKCSSCDYIHKTTTAVLTHIKYVHAGAASIKYRDQLSESERILVKLVAQECFPDRVIYSFVDKKMTFENNKRVVTADQENRVHAQCPESPKSGDKIQAAIESVLEKLNPRYDQKQSGKDASLAVNVNNGNSPKYTDCMIID